MSFKRTAAIFSLSAFLAGIIPCMASAGNCFSTSNPYYTLGSNSIQINRLTPAEIKELIDEEKNEYIKRAPDVFEFDNTLTEKVDHKILLISLIKLNYLFDKYEGFTTNFINYKRALNTKFRLQFDDHTGNMSGGINSINFGVQTTVYNQFYQWAVRFLCKFGINSPCDRGRELEFPITHEFGHVIEHLYIFAPHLELFNSRLKMKKSCDNIRTLRQTLVSSSSNYTDTVDFALLKEFSLNCILQGEIECLKSLNTLLKSELRVRKFIKTTQENIIQSQILQGLEGQNSIISAYGGQNSQEFFAEAFAHLECTDNPENVNEIGRKIESYIVNKMEYLPKENSKFNK